MEPGFSDVLGSLPEKRKLKELRELLDDPKTTTDFFDRLSIQDLSQLTKFEKRKNEARWAAVN